MIVERFKDELDHRLGVPVSIEVYKENYLVYPSLNGDTVVLEVRVGNWRGLQVISEVELENRASGSFYYFCRSVVDKVMSDLLRIGAQRA